MILQRALHALLFSTGVLSLALSAHADEYVDNLYTQGVLRILEECRYQIQDVTQNSPQDRCNPTRDPSGSPQVPRECRNAYANFYHNDTVTMRVAFGYYDTHSHLTVDIYERAAMIEFLTNPCPEPPPRTFFSCGFTRSPSDANELFKTIEGADGRPKRIRMLVTHSSATPNDDDNCQRAPGATSECRPTPAQINQTKIAQDCFDDGLREDGGAVFYVGHSRNGGGPSFSSPLIDSHGRPDYERYRREGNQSYQALQRVLRESSAKNKGPAFVGIFGCSSDRWFRKGVIKAAPRAGFAGNVVAPTFIENYKAALGAIDSLLGMKCRDNFVRSMTFPREGKNQRLIGFFR